jgi:RecB family exonuclease
VSASRPQKSSRGTRPHTFHNIFAEEMDARVKPAHDDLMPMENAL